MKLLLAAMHVCIFFNTDEGNNAKPQDKVVPGCHKSSAVCSTWTCLA